MNETVHAYDLDAVAYADASPSMPDSVRADVEDLVTRVGRGARVLEIGSGGGRDALLMERLGVRVRRTDITPGFVALLRAQEHAADLLDVATSGWTAVEVRSGVAGKRQESWLEVSALRGRLDP